VPLTDVSRAPNEPGSRCHLRTAARGWREEHAAFRRRRWGAPDWSATWTAAATSCAGSASMAVLRRSSTRRAACLACRGASCGPAAMSALLVEVAVHCGAVHADGLGDLGDGVLPLAVPPGSFMNAAHRGRPAGRSTWPFGCQCARGPGLRPGPRGCPRRPARAGTRRSRRGYGRPAAQSAWSCRRAKGPVLDGLPNRF